MERSTEESVGILCYTNNAEPISGIIKDRYSDFHVHEIDKNGNVVYLTENRVISEVSYPDGYEEWLSSGEGSFTFQPTSEDQVTQIYYSQPTFSVLTLSDKRVVVEKMYKKKTRPVNIQFVLFKVNMNQQEAISRIARKVDKPKKFIGFAGTKDKRAITTQLCSIKNVSMNLFVEATSKLEGNLKISDIRYIRDPLTLGDLSGNRFTIVLRDLQASSPNLDINDATRNSIDALKESGFINYFGMQRFGTSTIPTHYIGILILQREWSKIIDTLLEPQENEIPALREAKLLYQKTHDAQLAMKKTPKSAQAELAIFKAIAHAQQPNPLSRPYELFSQIDRRMRMIYVHAYQSYLWNHLVSQRLQEYGNEVHISDLVMIDEDKKLVTEVTEDNIHNYSIFDVVIPLPGRSISNMKQNLIDLMAQDNVTPEMFQKLSGEYGAGGDLRHILAMPKDLEWEILRYNDSKAALIDSDLDVLEHRTNRTNCVENGRFIALKLSFSLSNGQYATMCMRELLKRSTEWFVDSEFTKKKDEDEGSSWWPNICTIC